MIRTRFAPSPTGYLHVGGLRTALYSYAFAKKQKGTFILRIEDTDQERFIEGAETKLKSILKTFHISWDEGPDIGGEYSPYVQSERVPLGDYKKAAERLVEKGHAYYSFSKKESLEEINERREHDQNLQRDIASRTMGLKEVKQRLAAGEKPAIRLKVPEGEDISYADPVSGKKVTWNSSDVPDAVLLKSDGFPTYHLAVVVDDVAMKVTHVIRSHEWIPSTPIMLLTYKYLGYTIPEIIHLTALLDPDGGKLSKRKGNVSCEQFLEEGYLPEAILNFIMLLGWAPKDNRELFTLEEFVEEFGLEGLQKSNPVFNRKKLTWFNSQYLQKLSDDKFLMRVKEYITRYSNSENSSKLLSRLNEFKEIVVLLKTRVKTLGEVAPSLSFLVEKKSIPNTSDVKQLKNISSEQLKLAREKFEKLFDSYPDSSKWVHSQWEQDVRQIGDEMDLPHGKVFMLLRIFITYSPISPPLFESMVVLGKDEVLQRIHASE